MPLSSTLSWLLNPLLTLPLFSFVFVYCVVDYYSQPGGVPLTRMTVKGGTSQACAACKYQRRKCTPDCPLAPFFPPDKPKMFQNAHRLYGVSNILKIINHLSPPDKTEAMKSIIYQSDMREKYPVYGCTGIIAHLTQQIQLVDRELQEVRRQLDLCRQHQHHQNQISSPPQQYSPSSQFQELQISGDNKNVLPLFNPHPFSSIPVGGKSPSPQYQSFVNSNAAENDYIDNSLWFQQQQYNNNNNNLLAIQPQSFSPEFPHQQQVGVFQEYDDISPNLFDDRRSFIESKEACESSCESSLRDAKPSPLHVEENELKDAAAGKPLLRVLDECVRTRTPIYADTPQQYSDCCSKRRRLARV